MLVTVFFVIAGFDVEPAGPRIDNYGGPLTFRRTQENVTDVFRIFVESKVNPRITISLLSIILVMEPMKLLFVSRLRFLVALFPKHLTVLIDLALLKFTVFTVY